MRFPGLSGLDLRMALDEGGLFDLDSAEEDRSEDLES